MEIISGTAVPLSDGRAFIGQVGQIGRVRQVGRRNRWVPAVVARCGSWSTRQGATQLAPVSEGANAPERPAGKRIRYM
ncbi:hypothetical protein [Porphyromonas sp. HMSC077F02]|uniref:hypothetical protein n=1 Tax=Porphyromonas sp. HMSC077F02 TaxID=1739529 RepID=UPI00114CF8DA|nr:hypothetical protein [Porphyromonas sp. HMSC077F02]